MYGLSESRAQLDAQTAGLAVYAAFIVTVASPVAVGMITACLRVARSRIRDLLSLLCLAIHRKAQDSAEFGHRKQNDQNDGDASVSEERQSIFAAILHAHI